MPFAGYKDFADCVAKNQDKTDPEAYCAVIKRQVEGEAYRHPDFKRILDEFNNYYCKDNSLCHKGEDEYYQWLKALSLDENLPYGATAESFKWAKNMLQYLREDNQYKYYRVLIGFPIRSMNGNVYKERDLIAAALTLKGIHPNLNHKDEWHFTPESRWGEITTEDARYEDGAIEAILRVSKSAVCPICEGKPMTKLIDSKRIVNVSLQGGCAYGQVGGVCDGFQFDDKGFSLLTSDVLPGIPMARIFPLESIMVEALQTSTKGGKKVKKLVMEVLEDDDEIKPGSRYCDEHPNDPRCKAHKAAIHGEQEEQPCPEGQKRNPETGECEPVSPEEQMTQVIGIDAPVKTTSEPDEHGQCPEGKRLNALGKCVDTEECPEDQHWSAEANEGQGGCVPDTVPKPEHPETQAGKPVATEDVLTDAPTEVPTPGEQPPVLSPPDKPMPVTDDTPEGAPSTLPTPITPEEEPAPEPHTCEPGYHYDADADMCVPNITMPEAPAGVTSAEQRLELSQAKFSELKAKGKLETVQKQVAFWQNQFNTVNVERLKLRGQVEQQNRQIDKLDKTVTIANQKFNNMVLERDDQRRKWEREVAERETWKERAETYKQKYDDVSRKYNGALKTNLRLSNQLTQAHEDYLGKATEADRLHGQLNKAKSISKKIIKLKT